MLPKSWTLIKMKQVFKNQWRTHWLKFPPAMATILPSLKMAQPLFFPVMVSWSKMHLVLFLVSMLFLTNSFPNDGKAMEFLTKTVYSSAWPMSARSPCSGSVSISIGHQDSTSQVWFPSGGWGLKEYCFQGPMPTPVVWICMYSSCMTTLDVHPWDKHGMDCYLWQTDSF